MANYRCVRTFIVAVTAMVMIALDPSPSAAQQHERRGNAATFLTALSRWRSALRSVNVDKPYVVLAVPTSHCIGCGASAINLVIEDLDTCSLHPNVLVVVATEVPKEGVALK